MGEEKCYKYRGRGGRTFRKARLKIEENQTIIRRKKINSIEGGSFLGNQKIWEKTVGFIESCGFDGKMGVSEV